MTRLTLKRAKEILATPPKVLDEYWWEDKRNGKWLGWRKVVDEYANIERTLHRVVVMPSDTGWQP